MSDPTTTTTPPPRILSVMGDMMFPEVMARVAHCSKLAHRHITPVLEMKLRDRRELYHMLRRIFPGIADLSDAQDSLYYNALIREYFSPSHVPLPAEINYWVGSVVNQYEGHILNRDRISFYVLHAMQSAEGRRRVLGFIGEWREVLNAFNTHVYTLPMQRLDVLEDCIRRDFAVRNGRVCGME